MTRQLSPAYRAARRTAKRGGFSLVETMIAMLVLGFGLLTIASAQVYAVKGGQAGRHRTRAVTIAQDRMEQLQSMNWDEAEMAPTGWTAVTDVNTVVESSSDQVEKTYGLQRRITNVIANQTRSIDVRVTWTDTSGVVKNFTLTSTRFNFEGL